MTKSTDEIQQLVTDWYSQQWVWEANAPTYPKAPDYIDCLLLDIPRMVTDKWVLNLGCCYPSDEMQFSDTAKKWVAIDISEATIKRCKQLVNKPNVMFFQMDMTFLQFTDIMFDSVFDFSSGDHLPESAYDRTLKEVYRVLKFGGYFICTFASLDSFPEREYFGDFGYFRSASLEEIKKKVVDVGLKVIREHTDGDRIGLVARK